MKKNQILAGLLAVALVAVSGYGLYQFGVQQGARPGSTAAAAAPAMADPQSSIAAGEAATRRHIQDGLKAGDVDPANSEKIIYYHDPMVPGKRFDAPAKSPFMDMMLVPVYGGNSGGIDGSNITVSPRVQQNLGLRTAEVVRGSLTSQLQAIGNIAWNERDQSVIQPRAAGFIEKLYVRATFDAVKAGQPFADVYVPDWVAAQQEFLAVQQAATGDTALVAAARQRMQLLGMTEAQMARVAATGTVQPRTTLTVPTSGVVAELVAKQGMTVTPGMTLARINGIATVWALADVPESQAMLLRKGSRVEGRSPGAGGTVFTGQVEALLPEVNPSTRTLKARIQLANAGGALSPGMLVNLTFLNPPSAPLLLVPTEAIIATGQRMVVMLAEEGGRYRPVNVDIGVESAGQTEIKKGLMLGQRVVVSSQFLVDSEASLKGVEARLNNTPAATQPIQPTPLATIQHTGEGKVDAVNADGITLSHGPIPSAGWGDMTMTFQPPTAGLPRNVAVGDRVQFEFVLPKDGEPTITRIGPVASAAAAAKPTPGASK
jgi:Cu(I)/Ag(I) efflux system membrane fusion protein